MWKFFGVGVMCVLLLTGCISSNVKYEHGMRIATAGETNLFRPSLSVMAVEVCIPKEGRHTMDIVDGDEHHCYGEYKNVATVQGTQAGALTGIGSAAIQGGAIVGGAYLLGDGIRDSADNTNVSQQGGGATAKSGSRSSSSSQSSSRQSQGQYQKQSQSQMQMSGRMRGRD